MLKTKESLVNNIVDAIGQHQHLVIAFSGGIDSTVLLHQLVTLRKTQPILSLRAIYIHHGLSRNADKWADHCQTICQQWQVECQILHVQVESVSKGIEAGARTARYQALSESLCQDEVLLTAQHLDDQCETFLLALKRGSGPAGLSSMAQSMPFKNSLLIRPLLNISRWQIEQYAHQHHLDWIEDESNQDTRFDRNFLRISVLPLLNARWPHFAQSVARSASLCAEQEQLLDELLAEQLTQLMDQAGTLAIGPLKNVSQTRRWGILRRWLAYHNLSMPSRTQLEQLWHNVALSQPDAEPCLLLDNIEVRRFRQRLFIITPTDCLRDNILDWPDFISSRLNLPDNLGQLSVDCQVTDDSTDLAIRLPTQNESVTVRFTAQGNIRIIGRDRARSLKKLWQELNIPPWQRGRIPLVFFGETLITAVGLFVTQEGAGQQVKERCYIQWQNAQRIVEYNNPLS